MKHRKLGNSPLEVAPLCIGGNVFGWTIDQAASFRVLDAALDGGLNFIDTADIYSRWVEGHAGGESETIIGKWLQQNGKRDQVVIATKLGFDMGNGKKGLSKARITQAVDESLTRLQTDVIDLYQAHTDDQETPLEETLAGFADVIKAGNAERTELLPGRSRCATTGAARSSARTRSATCGAGRRTATSPRRSPRRRSRSRRAASWRSRTSLAATCGRSGSSGQRVGEVERR